MEEGKKDNRGDKVKKSVTLKRFKENLKYKEGDVDLSNYRKRSGPNRQLFIGIKKVEIELYRLFEKYGLTDDDVYPVLSEISSLRDVSKFADFKPPVKTDKRMRMYRVVLFSNGRKKKELKFCREYKTAIKEFNRVVDESDKVKVPKTVINVSKVFTPVDFEIKIMKIYEPNDRRRVYRDELGKLQQEDFFEKKWVILDSEKIVFEETFHVYGYGHLKHNRFTLDRLMDEIIPRELGDPKFMKNIRLINNKIVLHGERYFDLIIAKTKNDASALYSRIKNLVAHSEIKNIFFEGDATKFGKPYDTYRMIQDRTDMPWDRIIRTDTRA
jgi:hypothetical protein